MKIWVKFLILFFLLFGNSANADSLKILFLPVDLFSVCENYYCFPESSEIFANDVINNFAKTGKLQAYSIYDVRKKINEVPTLKPSVSSALDRYRNSNTINFEMLKKVAAEFKVNSILLVSSSVNQQFTKRNAWEILEVMSAFKAYERFTLETNVVLVDNVNDIVMWSGKYKRNLGDNETRFWARNAAESVSQLEKMRLYSKEVVAPNVSQNVILRFFPKSLSVSELKPLDKTQTKDFRPNALDGMNNKLYDVKELGDVDSESIFTF